MLRSDESLGSDAAPSITSSIDGFEKYLKSNYSPRTANDYLKVMRRFFRTVSTFDKQAIATYLSTISEKMPETYNRNLKAIKAYARFTDKEDLLKCFDYKSRAKEFIIDDLSNEVSILAYDDFRKVVDVETDTELRTFWLMCRQSRPSELIDLQWANIDFVHDKYDTSKFHNGVSKRSWGGFLDEELEQLLTNLKAINTEKPFKYQRDYYHDQFAWKCEKVLGQKYHLKDIRSAFSDYAFAKNGNPIITNLLQGRSAKSIDVLLKSYARPKLSTLKQAFGSL